jgi:hypothetical protein
MRSSSTCGAVALAALATILLGAGSCCAVAVPTLSVVLGHGFGLENVVTVYIYIYITCILPTKVSSPELPTSLPSRFRTVLMRKMT